MRKFRVTGMNCAACSARVERAVSSLEGIESCSVNLLTGILSVEGETADGEIENAVMQAGYGIEPEKTVSLPAPKPQNAQVSRLIRRLVFSAGFLLLLLYLSMGYTMWGFPLPPFFTPFAVALTEGALALCVIAVNRDFFVSGMRGVIHGAPNMDTLVSLGSAAAFLYSAVLTVRKPFTQESLHNLYFESAAMILTLITVGKLLEALAKGKTTNALHALASLSPENVTVERNGKEETVPIADLQIGDVFILRPGDRIPADGIFLEGNLVTDESALTGESMPVQKRVGDEVYTATVSRNGFAKCRATQVGEDTALSRIIRMVNDATATKAPIARVADRVSAVFVPAVLGVALLTLFGWVAAGRGFDYALTRAVSVLVISCPCALGLATPVAVMVGSGVGASHGILFKTAASLELCGKVKTVALDKTGTLTHGTPRVTDLFPADGVEERLLLALAASLEAKSEHPLAHAILQKANEENLPLLESSEFKVDAGSGLRAVIDGKIAVGGNRKYVGVLSTAAEERGNSLADEGKTPLYFAYGDTFLGIIAVADTLKEDSAAAVAELKVMGIRPVMLTGDNAKTSLAVARLLGLDEDNVIAEVRPNKKEETVRSLGRTGLIAMVGDGINDAPALARADVGIAIGAGADIAVDSADVVLTGSSLSGFVDAVRLSRAVLRTVYENLFWAFLYNVIGIPLAAGVFGLSIPPTFGAAAMSLSGFCVVTNALRLNLWKKKKKETKTVKKEWKIEGMMCAHCEAHVKKALEALPNVSNVTADHVSGKVTAECLGELSDAAVKAVVEKEGYRFIG